MIHPRRRLKSFKRGCVPTPALLVEDHQPSSRLMHLSYGLGERSGMLNPRIDLLAIEYYAKSIRHK